MGVLNGIGEMGLNFAKGVADTISKTGVGQKGIGFYNDVIKMTDDEIAKNVIKKGLNKPDSNIGKMFTEMKEAGLDPSSFSTNDLKTAYIGNETSRLESANIKENMTESAIKKAQDKNAAKAARSWQMEGAGSYFGTAEDGFNKKRLAAAGGAALGTYAAGSVLNRAVGPGTITRDEYGNRDIVGVPFI